MHTKRPTSVWKTALSEGLVVVVIIFLAIFGLSAQKTLPDISLPFDFYTATTNESGIAFYQKQDHVSYSISPYNDYSVTDRTRTAFLPVPRTGTATISRPENAFPFNLGNQALTYLGIGRLLYILNYAQQTTQYNALVQNNSLEVTRTVTFSGNVPDHLGMTILFSRDDVIADQYGELMTESSDTNKALLEEVTGKPITRAELIERRVIRSGNTVVLLNPHTAGSLLITVPTAEFVVVDNEAKLIEFVEPFESGKQNTVQTTMTIQSKK